MLGKHSEILEMVIDFGMRKHSQAQLSPKLRKLSLEILLGGTAKKIIISIQTCSESKTINDRMEIDFDIYAYIINQDFN